MRCPRCLAFPPDARFLGAQDLQVPLKKPLVTQPSLFAQGQGHRRTCVLCLLHQPASSQMAEARTAGVAGVQGLPCTCHRPPDTRGAPQARWWIAWADSGVPGVRAPTLAQPVAHWPGGGVPGAASRHLPRPAATAGPAPSQAPPRRRRFEVPIRQIESINYEGNNLAAPRGAAAERSRGIRPQIALSLPK